MKIKLHKLLGAALTVTMLVSLMIGAAAAPVAADELEWSTQSFPKPGADADWFRGDADDDIRSLGPMAKAIDGTLWLGAWIDDDTDGNIDSDETKLFTSTDGREWDETEYDGGLITAMACSSLDADIVYVADIGMNVYKTTNAGKKWSELADATGTGTMIAGIDVGYIDEDPHVFIGTTDFGGGGDVYVLQEAVFAGDWTELEVDTDRDSDGDGATDWGDGYADVWDVRVSPNFEDDQFVVAVATDYSDNITYCTTKYGGAAWGATLYDDMSDTDPDTRAEARLEADGYGDLDYIYKATIFLPTNFDSDEDSGEMEYFVGIASFDTGEGDVYRIVTTNTWDRDIAGSDTAFNVTGLDGVGDVGDCYLLAVGNEAAALTATAAYRSDDNGSTWTEEKEGPSGNEEPSLGMIVDQALVSVVVADDYADSGEAFMATVGDNAAVSFTKDYGKTCDQISMISADFTGVESLSTGEQQFIVVSSTNDTDEQLYRMDADGNWDRTYLGSDVAQVQQTRDGDVFVMKSTGTISRSTDGGTRFSAQLSDPPDFTGGWKVIDKSTVIVGGTDEVFKTTNNGTTWKTYDDGLTGAGDVLSIVLSPDFDADETLILATDAGDIFRSTDGGESWKELTKGGFDADAGVTYAIFHAQYADNGVMFAAGVSGGDLVVQRYGVDDEGWEDISPSGFTTGGATGIVVGPEGTLYVSDVTAKGVFRSLNPTTSDTAKVYWENVIDEFTGSDANNIAQLQLTVGGSNDLWGIEGDTGYVKGNKIWQYEDTLTGKPTLSSPTDGSSTGRVDRADLAWSAMDGADEYDVWVDTDPGFKSGSAIKTSSEVTSKMITGLEDGQTYYWRVRVMADEPVRSNWSATWSFTTKLGAGEWNPFVGGVPESPANGATNVPLTPSFAWNSADWATGYEFVLAKDAAFSDTIVSKTGANALSSTVYLSEQKLENSTTYYWRVRAVSKTSNSEWASAVFTTEGVAPAPPAPPAPPPPAPPPPGTPAYIWVIIGIGALLVIAVIVLIVRTRRVA